MSNFNTLRILLIIEFALLFNQDLCAKLNVLEENFQHTTSPLLRLRRQTHPASTIAKIPSQDNNVFIPIVGPTQPSFPPSQISSNTVDLPLQDTLVDYLLPPNPDAQLASFNFQDTSFNLQTLDNVFDVKSPTSNNAIASFQNIFSSSPPNFQNQLILSNLPTTQSTFINDQVQSISFQNPPFGSSSTPSLTSANPTAPTANLNQFSLNKASNSLNRETTNLLNTVNQFNIPSQFGINNFAKSESLALEPQNQGKFDLGFNANEILVPPNEELGRNEYDTINVSKFKKPNTGISPPANINQPNQLLPSTQFSPQHNQLGSTPTQFGQFFNQFSPPGNSFLNDQLNPQNTQIISSKNQLSNQLSANRENQNEQSNVVWGVQKQPNFNPTTNTPFLPTVPPNTNTQQNANKFENSVFQNQPQFQNNGALFQFPNLNQNSPFETPLTSQFDSFLPQGTVSDHSTLPFSDNLQHFLSKRQTDEENEEVEEEEVVEDGAAQEQEPEEPKNFAKTGPVYSFVKTDKNGHYKWSVRHPSRR